MIFVGVDWAEDHHDVCVLDVEGKVLGRRRISDSLGGVSELHALVAQFLTADSDGFRTPVPIDSVQRFRSFRTPRKWLMPTLT